MKNPFAAVLIAALALTLAAGVFLSLRDDESSVPESVSVASSQSGVSAPAARYDRSTEDDGKSSADQPIDGAPIAAQMQTRTEDGRVGWPPNIENRIWEYFAHRGKSNITSIISIECTRTDCEIVFTGTEVNPRFVDTFSDLHADMSSQPWNVRQSGIGTREIAPGVRAYVIGISNIPYDESRRRAAEPEGTRDSKDE